VDRRSRQPPTDNLFVFFRIEGGAAAGAAESETRPNDGRVTGVFDNLFGFGPRLRKAAAWHQQAGFIHRLLEEQPVFRDFDSFAFGANHFDAAFFQHARVVQSDREVQSRLSTHGWQ
jgi:hypothetical protein